MNMRSHHQGFTLLELMIAMSIFAIMSTVAYLGLDSIMRSDIANKQQLEQIGQLQRSLMFLERDLRQAQPRKARISYDQVLDDILLGVDTSRLLELTVGGHQVLNPESMRSSMQRVRYGLEDNVLYRYQWTHVDYSEAEEPLKMRLLEQVDSINFVWLGKEGKPKQDQSEQSSLSSAELVASPPIMPVALQLELEHQTMGRIIRLLPVYSQ